MTSPIERMRYLLADIYDASVADKLAADIEARYPAAGSERGRRRFSNADAMLITYADAIRGGTEPPLRTLGRVVDEYADEYSYLHVLPFFPSSGDGGFSIVDFTKVDPANGTWNDVSALAGARGLMVDLVLNHVSVRSDWFQRFVSGDPEYAGWFHVVDPDADLSAVFRPRTHPLLTEFDTASGPAHVWTTFSPDQVDLDYSHPPVLEAVLDVLADYVEHGARAIRLDAVGFVWKELGTSCLHHPKTHAMVRLIRAFLDLISPEVQVITETNVPHEDNVAYFGDGHDEAQVVYNFSLPPLVVDAFAQSSAADLSEWAATLATPEETTFLNFLASHDGIGVTPAYPVVGARRVAQLAERTRHLGGDWSGRATGDGTVVPYELNIGFIDALAGSSADGPAELASRMLAAASIQFAIQGVPGVYIHSHLDSRSWWDGPRVTGDKRSINRERLTLDRLSAELGDAHGLRATVVAGHRRLLRARREHPEFDPYRPHVVAPVDPRVFSVLRHGDGGDMWCVTNVAAQSAECAPLPGWERRRDVLSGATESGRLELGPHEYRWFQR